MSFGAFLRVSGRWLLAGLWCAAFVPAYAQQGFVDDAQREAVLPGNIERVFAAGAPAEVLLYTLVPEKLVGRNHMPTPAALEFTPPELRSPVPITQLPNPDDAQADTELRALGPDVYIDYGDVTADYISSLNNVQQRTGIPSIILDGAIDRIPATYRRLGGVLGVKERGELLAAHVERLLAKYEGILQRNGEPPRVYLACSPDGLAPCLEGERNGEIVRILGATNVAGSVENAVSRRATIDDIRRWNPDVIIAANEASAARMRDDASWKTVEAVARGRVLVPPAIPFNWGPRPPSVNRLAGLIWFAYVLPGRPFDAVFFADAREFFRDFYHVTPSDEQLRRVVDN